MLVADAGGRRGWDGGDPWWGVERGLEPGEMWKGDGGDEDDFESL